MKMIKLFMYLFYLQVVIRILVANASKFLRNLKLLGAVAFLFEILRLHHLQDLSEICCLTVLPICDVLT